MPADRRGEGSGTNKVNERPTRPPARPMDPDRHTLASLEVQLRNLRGVQLAAEPIIERLHADFPELTTRIQSQLLDCDLESLVELIRRLRLALESER
jgi:hypothetical protein